MADVTAPFGFPYPEDTDLVRDGAADIEALAEGVNDQLALGFVYVGTRYYTSSGTFVKADPFGDSSFDGAKLRAIRVRCVGGGGGGGGCATTGAGQIAAGGAGAGGAYTERFINDITLLATSETVTRGDGGSGGTAGNNAGSAGGVSSFGTLLTANAGAGGGGGAAAVPASMIVVTGAAGVTGSNADVVRVGQRGIGSSTYSTSTGLMTYGFGGGSGWSQNTSSSLIGGSQAGSTAVGIGSGGGGGANLNNDVTARAGATGSAGIVIVDVFA